MMYGYLEDYVDDIVVKSKEVEQHIDDLREENPLSVGYHSAPRNTLDM